MMRPSIAATLLLLAPPCSAQAVDGFGLVQATLSERSRLEPPKDLWEEVKRKVGFEGRRLGYTHETMLNFPQSFPRLRIIDNNFRDALLLPRFSGVLTDNLLAAAEEPAQLVQMAWNQLDARAGRSWPAPPKDDWGVAWAPKGTDPLQVIEKSMSIRMIQVAPGWKAPKLPVPALRALNEAGAPLRKLLARLIVAADVAAPFCWASYDRSELQRLPRPGGPTWADMYNALTSPYRGDVNDDTIIVSNRAAYETLRRFDANQAAFASIIFFTHVGAALKEYRAAQSTGKPVFQPVTIPTGLGKVVLAGWGNDRHPGGGAIVVDLGGDDRYEGANGTPNGLGQPVGIVLDLSGDDSYVGPKTGASLGGGFLGIGAVLDLAGNDRYQVQECGLGAGLYGTGLLLDYAGNDRYEVAYAWGQGAAYAGVGLLADLAGNDVYRTTTMSMGFGGTYGFGCLLDRAGNDDYKTADEGNPGIAWGGRTLSMCLGMGYGRRADSGDGENQGGGFGVVVDAAGDDRYHTNIFGLGSGYWWGFGIFEDRAGDDQYRCTHYCVGSGAHFGLGSFVDLAGNDRYNDRPDAVERWGGIARDGSIAVAYDGGGNDVWGHLTGGHADLNSIAVFWDREGDDAYSLRSKVDPNAQGNKPYGSATTYAPFLNFRDEMESAGIFLDTGGKDTYPEGFGAAENSLWQFQKGPLVWSVGIDR